MDMINNLLLEVFAACAEFEMEKREKRQREGYEALKARGEWDKLGRPVKMTQEEFLNKWDQKGKNVTDKEFAESLNISKGTLQSYKKKYLIDYDEVRSGHTYTEYQEAKNLYKAIKKEMLPLQKREITEAWIKEANGEIIETDGNYRTGSVYIGNLVEAVYYSPNADNVPELMDTFLKSANFEGTSVKESLEKIALTHIQFERIHPFKDGNGRVGRMILNQQLINNGLLPVTFSAKGKYRQAFRIYDRNKDTSSIVHIIGKAQEEAISRITQLDISLKKSLDINKGEQFEW